MQTTLSTQKKEPYRVYVNPDGRMVKAYQSGRITIGKQLTPQQANQLPVYNEEAIEEIKKQQGKFSQFA